MSYRPTRYIRATLESGATVEVVTDNATYGLKLTSSDGTETRCRLSAEAVAAISSGFNALALGKGEPIKYEWRVVKELHKLEQEAPTTGERAKALEDAAPLHPIGWAFKRAAQIAQGYSQTDLPGGITATRIAAELSALSASPPEVVEGKT